MRHITRLPKGHVRGVMVVAALAALALGATLTAPPQAHAATFTVTKTADTNDGVCDGDCSLREAIAAANTAPGADTVMVPAGTYTLTIPGADEDANATGDLDVTDAAGITIQGNGQGLTMIDGGGPGGLDDRLFDVLAGPATFHDVTIRGGNLIDGGFGAHGGGIQFLGSDLTIVRSTLQDNASPSNGGAIRFLSGGTLTLTDSTIRDNTTGSNKSGGGIDQIAGDLTITRSTLSDNMAPGSSGSNGGAIRFSGGLLTLTDSTISGNHAQDGGGVYQTGGSAMISGSTISGNTAVPFPGGPQGGGWYVSFGLSFTAVNSMFLNNVAGREGGGIYFSNGATAMITDTVISGNHVGGGGPEDGGGIFNRGDLFLDGVTISNNTAEGNGGGLYNKGDVKLFVDTTISGNSAMGNGGGIGNDNDFRPDISSNAPSSGRIIDNSAGMNGGGIFNIGAVDVSGLEISGNTAGEGGGVWNDDANFFLTNSTISGNTATTSGGGGYTGSGSTSTLDWVTITNNTAPLGAGHHGASGPANLHNTIIANQTAGPNCSGTSSTTNGNNLISDASCFAVPLAGDLENTDPLLGPLQNNGGFSQTHALLPGSPALSAGGAPLAAPFDIDQRGAPRSAVTDIGAYERNHVDLAITKSDGQTQVLPGQALGYAIVVSNAGPDPAIDAVVTDTFLAPLIAGGWTCVTGGGGGVCDTAAGVGNIATTVDLPVGGSVIFSATATVATPSAGLAPNTATVAVAAIAIDLDPSNNSATDVDTIPAPVAVLPGGGAGDDDGPTPAPACALGGFTQGTTGPEGGTVTGGNGCITVAGGPDLDITIATRAAGGDQPPTPGSILVGGVIVQITATDPTTGDPVTTFDPALTICVTIEPDGATGPALMYWTGSAWAPGANPTYNPATGEACAEFDHLTDFAVLGTLPAEEEEEPVVKEEEPAEDAGPSATLALVAGGQFVQWSFGDSSAAAVFAVLKIAWLFNRDAVSWTSFVPQLGVTDFALADSAVLWLVAFADTEIAVG